MRAPYKTDWRGRIVFKNIGAVIDYYLLAYSRGKKQGYLMRMRDEKMERINGKKVTL